MLAKTNADLALTKLTDSLRHDICSPTPGLFV